MVGRRHLAGEYGCCRVQACRSRAYLPEIYFGQIEVLKAQLLIAPKGIEIKKSSAKDNRYKLLIAPKGIEMK